jgi:hypothetical protein
MFDSAIHLPDDELDGAGFAAPSAFAVAGVMPSVVDVAGPSIADGVGPIALFESSVLVACAMFVPSEAGVAPVAD